MRSDAMTTLAEQFELTKGRPAGFDYMRICFALGVVAWHTSLVTYGYAYQEHIFSQPGPYRMVVAAIVPMFFALSGFLVAGSLERCKTLPGFLTLRVLRIFPALTADVILSAFLLGGSMTQLSLWQYFHNPVFYQYLLNCLGDIHYHLPGLFLNNPYPRVVNQQLWTVPFELECYLLLSALSLLGIAKRRKLLLYFVLALVAYGLIDYLRGHDRSADDLHGNQLVLCFLIGVLFYGFRHHIAYTKALGFGSIAASFACFCIPGGGLLAPLPITYATIFLGLTSPPRLFFMKTGDYSYGIYLYGFPIQQAVIATGLVPLNGWLTLGAALPFIIFTAVMSWHFFELPMLSLRRYRPQVDRLFAFLKPDLLWDAAWHAVARLRPAARRPAGRPIAAGDLTAAPLTPAPAAAAPPTA
jgi:peptidoglycan/LPS O-acetylase OafA/YrhL